VPTVPDFHDGWLDGLRIDEQRVEVFLRTHTLEKYVVVANGVAALAAGNIKAGNIMFEAVIRSSGEITVDHIDELYELPLADPVFERDDLLRKAKNNNWFFSKSASHMAAIV
jgi:hypothetical protein